MSEENNPSVSENQNDDGAATGGIEAQDTPATPTGNDIDQQAKTLLRSAEPEGDESDKQTNETKDEGKKEEPVEGAPESYDDFHAPDGMEFDAVVIDRFKDVAKEFNLPQTKAQAFLDKMAPVIADRQIARINAISNEWAEKSKTDKEIGGENFARSMSDIARLRDKFAMNDDGNIDPDIDEFMNSPMGNHPGCLKLLARAGRAFGEAGFPKGSAPKANEISPADFYK